MATTVANRRENVSGSYRMIMATITTSTSSDTWATGLKVIRGLSIGDGTNASPTSVSVNGGTVTIGSAGGVTGGLCMAWGY